MKEDTLPTAAALLSEWNQKSWTESKFSNHQDWRERRQAIATRLDVMCKESNLESDGKGNLKTPCNVELPMKEFLALTEWLAIKDERNPQ